MKSPTTSDGLKVMTKVKATYRVTEIQAKTGCTKFHSGALKY